MSTANADQRHFIHMQGSRDLVVEPAGCNPLDLNRQRLRPARHRKVTLNCGSLDRPLICCV